MRFAERIKSRIGGSELVIFEHLSHAGLHEDPETFNRVTLDFLLRQRSKLARASQSGDQGAPARPGRSHRRAAFRCPGFGLTVVINGCPTAVGQPVRTTAQRPALGAAPASKRCAGHYQMPASAGTWA